jgi:hypothetical protein
MLMNAVGGLTSGGWGGGSSSGHSQGASHQARSAVTQPESSGLHRPTRTLERVAANVGVALGAGRARRGPQAVAGRLVVEEALVAQHHVAGLWDRQEAVGLGAAGEQNQGGGKQGEDDHP